MALFNWLMPEIEHQGITYSLVFVQQRQLRLRITGTGRIPGNGEFQPWLPHCHRITDIWIGEGIVEIGNGAFHNCSQLQRVWLPGTLTRLGNAAFADSPLLEQITYEGSPAQLRKVAVAADAIPSRFGLRAEEVAHEL